VISPPVSTRARRGGPTLALLAAAIVLCLCQILGAGTTSASGSHQVLHLNAERSSYNLALSALILPEPIRGLGISKISSPQFAQRFQPMPGDTINLGPTSSVIWLRFTVINGARGDEGGDWLLTLNQPTMLNAELYALGEAGDGWVRIETLSRTLTSLPSPNRYTLFRLPPGSSQPRTYYLKLSARAALMAAPQIWAQSAFLKKSRFDMLLLGAYCGTILALAFYNLFLFFYIKDQSYLWYVLTMIAMAVYFLGLSGLLQDYLDMVPPALNLDLPIYSLGLAYLCRGLFARSFLMTKAATPKLDKLLLFCSVFMGLMPCLLPVAQLEPWPAKIVSTGAMAWPLLLLWVGVGSLRSGFKPARYFLLAYFFAGMASVFFAWTLKGWIPFMVWNLQVQQVGYIIEAILLSIALGYRINTLRKAKAGAQQALRVSEERYRKLLEAAPDPMAVYGQEWRVTYLNPAFTKVFGWDADDLSGANNSFVPADLKGKEQEALRGVLAGREFSERETNRLTKSGQTKEVSLSAAILRGVKGQASGAVVTFRDISERKQAERELLAKQTQLRKLTMELTASEERQRKAIAEDLHDSVSQNLATGLLNLRIARDGASDPGNTEALDGVCQVINQALLDTRSLTFEISPPVLYDYGLAAGLEWLAESIQKRHGLQIIFSEKSGIPGINENLSVTLFRASRELLINAVKHAQAQQAELSISAEDGQVVVQVIDNGVGFDPQLQRTGLPQGFGLFSIRERLELLGGSMTIESPPDGEDTGVHIILRAPLHLSDV
jgi:PAS domain S-box-containing protein